MGRDVGEVTATLESLIPRRLVRLDSPGMAAPGLKPEVEGEKRYRLGPFMVGWYEANMRLLDKEFAELFEQYVIEGGGERILSPAARVAGRRSGARITQARVYRSANPTLTSTPTSNGTSVFS